MKDQRLEIRLTSAEKDRLYRYCRDRDIPVSNLVRFAIESYIRKRDKKGEYLLEID